MVLPVVEEIVTGEEDPIIMSALFLDSCLKSQGVLAVAEPSFEFCCISPNTFLGVQLSEKSQDQKNNTLTSVSQAGVPYYRNCTPRVPQS